MMDEDNNEWRAKLTDQQYQITREKGTERAFTGTYNDCKDKGIYRCICCNNALFSSETKYESGSGWPSFWDVAKQGNIVETVDNSLSMIRTEVSCKQCGAHLGHVFPDGPKPTGLRYCINSVSLNLEKQDE